MFKKLFIALFIVVGLFVATSVFGNVEAKAADNLGLAFRAKKDTVTGEVVTRVNNWTGARFNGYICVTEMSGGRSYHLGCLKPDLTPLYQGEPGSIQFGVMTRYGGSVRYTYQDASGVWRGVTPTTVL